MTEADSCYIQSLIESDAFTGPVLELGAGYGGLTCRKLILDAGFEYFASDLTVSEGVDYVADFSDPTDVARVFGRAQFQSVLVLNVLEHTFEPIKVLDSALTLVEPGGKLVVLTPALWPLHKYPVDCYRLLPDWYERYATTRRCALQAKHFEFVGHGNIGRFLDNRGEYQFPTPAGGRGFRRFWSRAIHKVFNTYGRGMAFPSHVAIGAVFRKPD